MRFSKYFDHTDLRPDARLEDITRLCLEAMRYRFMSVCVNPFYVPVAARLLKGSDVKVCTVVGFPLGQTTPKEKAREAVEAALAGADEIDMVMNAGMARSGEWKFVEAEIRGVREALDSVPGERRILKVILETCLLDDDEIVKACQVSVAAGADFVKTSTGFSTGGATVEAVRLMRKTVGADVGVKASGGIRNLETARAMVEAGASRLGCSSGVAIAKGEEADADY